MPFLLVVLLYLIIYLNLLILLKEPSKENALLTLHATTEMHFSLHKRPKKNLMHGLGIPADLFVGKTVLYDLALSGIDKL